MHSGIVILAESKGAKGQKQGRISTSATTSWLIQTAETQVMWENGVLSRKQMSFMDSVSIVRGDGGYGEPGCLVPCEARLSSDSCEEEFHLATGTTTMTISWSQ